MKTNKPRKAKHTPVAKWTSVMRKLNNEIEKEKQRNKVVVSE